MPVVALTLPENQDKYAFTQVGDVAVYASLHLRVKPGYTHIVIKLRQILWFRWLEVEGAMPLPLYGTD